MDQRHLPPAILAVGRNYAEHAKELGNDVTDRPLIFMKNPASVIDDGDAIVLPTCMGPDDGGPDQVDYEGELAVILGRAALNETHESALSAVGGYAAANDVTARWWQRHGSGGQFCRGKSFDTFCPIGTITPAALVPDPQRLHLITLLNGEIVQDDSTASMVVSVRDLIVELSRSMTLLPGTVILTGTPAGVGSARTPARFLRAGDEVEVRIEGVGHVCNRVVAAHAPAARAPGAPV